MLAEQWEMHATSLALCNSAEALWEAMEAIRAAECVPEPGTGDPVVFVGADTRPSSPELVACAVTGVQLTGVHVVNVGICSTPMLHFVVWEQRDGSFDHYFHRLAAGFRALTEGACTCAPCDMLL